MPGPWPAAPSGKNGAPRKRERKAAVPESLRTDTARREIFASIRTQLARSASIDIGSAVNHTRSVQPLPRASQPSIPLLQQFQESLESVGGKFIQVSHE